MEVCYGPDALAGSDYQPRQQPGRGVLHRAKRGTEKQRKRQRLSGLCPVRRGGRSECQAVGLQRGAARPLRTGYHHQGARDHHPVEGSRTAQDRPDPQPEGRGSRGYGPADPLRAPAAKGDVRRPVRLRGSL